MKPRITRTDYDANGEPKRYHLDLAGETAEIWRQGLDWHYVLHGRTSRARSNLTMEGAWEDLVVDYHRGSATLAHFAMSAEEAMAAEAGELKAYTKALREALKRVTGRTWSVTLGKGTAYSWIGVTAPPARRGRFGYMTPEDQALLADATGESPHPQGFSIPPTRGYQAATLLRVATGRPADSIECAEHAWAWD